MHFTHLKWKTFLVFNQSSITSCGSRMHRQLAKLTMSKGSTESFSCVGKLFSFESKGCNIDLITIKFVQPPPHTPLPNAGHLPLSLNSARLDEVHKAVTIISYYLPLN